MELLLGFLIAMLIAVTGVGAGSMTAPLLLLFLHVPASTAVGTALVYSAVVKLLAVAVRVRRRQIAWRTLSRMLITGVPGVVLGSILFHSAVDRKGDHIWLYGLLGAMIAFSSLWHIYRHFQSADVPHQRRTRPFWLSLVMLPIGAEVGYSSSGAGALGSIALLGLTSLEPADIVGTDLAFGFCLSFIGGTLHWATGGVDPGILLRLTAGGLLGAMAGSSLAHRIPARTLRLALSMCLLVIGIQLCWHAAALATAQVSLFARGSH
jgi:hypothetical protein